LGNDPCIGRAYELIKDEFICVPRGTIVIKGNGEMEFGYITGKKTVLPSTEQKG
jgi:hypothetical protein